jgi:hypothetical protein
VELQAVMRRVERAPGRTVDSVLDAGRRSQPVTHPDRAPQYRVNEPGRPREALPTLVSRESSHAFRDGKAGMVLDAKGNLTSLTVAERERALGYPAGSTAAPGLSDRHRHAVTGACMDAHCMEHLYAILSALQRWHELTVPVQIEEVELSVATLVVAALKSPTHTVPPDAVYDANMVQAMSEEQRDNVRAGSVCKDVWEDEPVMHYLTTGEVPRSVVDDRAEAKRVQKRASGYVLQGGKLFKRMSNHTLKEVPKPEDRARVITQVHERCGHFGVKRTMHLVLHGHWWRGVQKDVEDVVARCAACDRTKASFNARAPVLNPLAIEGMFYRWGVDLCGPFPKSKQGNVYVMVCVEYFTKQIEAVPIPDKTAETTTRVFLDRVICQYGACAEVVTDGGREFQGQFARLLEQCFIDHRTTSPNHPQADGLAERGVQMIKRALRRCWEHEKRQEDWDAHIPWLLLGYRCSKQATTNYCPYELLHAVAPTLPPALKARMSGALDFDDPEAAAASLLQRGRWLREACVMAGNNHRIAQHRDTLRYAILRGGAFSPKLRKFEVGDFVYLRQPGAAGPLAPTAKQAIYRVRVVAH